MDILCLRALILLNRYMVSALRVTLRTNLRGSGLYPQLGSFRIYDMNDQTASFTTEFDITCVTVVNGLFIFSRNLCLTGERLVFLMDYVFKYGSLNNGHSARRGMLKIKDLFIIVNCIIILLSSYPKGSFIPSCFHPGN